MHEEPYGEATADVLLFTAMYKVLFIEHVVMKFHQRFQ